MALENDVVPPFGKVYSILTIHYQSGGGAASVGGDGDRHVSNVKLFIYLLQWRSKHNPLTALPAAIEATNPVWLRVATTYLLKKAVLSSKAYSRRKYFIANVTSQQQQQR